jgi:hypothetical protein
VYFIAVGLQISPKPIRIKENVFTKLVSFHKKRSDSSMRELEKNETEDSSETITSWISVLSCRELR